MSFSLDISFTLLEWLAIMGMFQGLMIIVYIVFRVRDWRQASVALAYFSFLTLSFALQFATRLDFYLEEIRGALWFLRAMSPPLCYLLVLQVVRLVDLPEGKHFLILLAAPILITGIFFLPEDARYWLSSMTGSLCMLAIWGRRDSLSDLRRMKGGRERYWLVLTLIAANVMVLAVSLFQSFDYVGHAEADALKLILGISFAYLATTTLFRVYPPPVALAPRAAVHLTDEEKRIADIVRRLMDLDKVYQEPSFSRADLAREAGVSESVLSRIVNVSFGKSLPRLISEYRIADAQRLLLDSAIPVQIVAKEAGFNSLATFNRVFREMTGETPTVWRTRHLSS